MTSRPITGAAIALILAACGGPQDPGSENLTAEEHDRQAAAEEQQAEQAEGQYDPDARLTTGSQNPGTGVYYGTDIYNPTIVHLHDAQAHRDHAAAHAAMAAALRAYEEAECSRFPPASREACPLLYGLERVTDIEGGSQLTFHEGVDITPIVDHIRCHLAFAATQGLEGIDQCALYVPGAAVSVQGQIVRLTTTQTDHVADLRRRVAVQAP